MDNSDIHGGLGLEDLESPRSAGRQSPRSGNPNHDKAHSPKDHASKSGEHHEEFHEAWSQKDNSPDSGNFDLIKDVAEYQGAPKRGPKSLKSEKSLDFF